MKIAVAVTGASGVVYGVELIKNLASEELFIVVTDAAKKVMDYETGKTNFSKYGKVLEEKDIDASIASGSFQLDALVICPCSMKTLSAISTGFSNNIVTRSADVMIKERKKLILVLRETPLSPIHVENMMKLSKLGVILMPACPGFYHKPKTTDDMVKFMVGKIMDQLGLKNKLFKRWK